MDIGDPDEIPTRRKPLPSMQELGAFDLDAGRASPAPARPPVAAATASRTTSEARTTRPPAAATPALTPEQLRQALAKADPQTRQKLLSLIVGGRLIQQSGAGLAVKPVSTRSPPAAGSARAQAPPTLSRTPMRAPAGAAGAARSGSATLLQIDENTELLDASLPQPSPQQRKTEMQAQVDAALQQQDRQRTEAAAHKVIFPAYDPSRHGEDVRSTVRRRPEAPVEGHFPAPRQPVRTPYRHPDGKPMSAEESKVEEVLQAQRCEDTLTVLARDGVNGLLLSPRDLDAAVAGGVLDAATAASLWKTWSALRPVIHVIEDDPPEPASVGSGEPTPPVEALDPPAAAGPCEAALLPSAATLAPPEVVVALPAQPAPPAAVQQTPDPPVVPSAPPATTTIQASAAAPAALPPKPATAPQHRGWRPVLHWAMRAFVTGAVISTTWQLGHWLWHTGWGWTLLDWLQSLRP